MPHFLKNYIVVFCMATCCSMAWASTAEIEEIVVTATKRTQSLQDVAGSISALEDTQIKLRGVANTEDLIAYVPGANFNKGAGNTFISIRGIGLSLGQGFADPSVATHIDGVFLARTNMGSLQMIDLERAEVLRGPQGTLYGRNATGGVINFITKKPTEEFEGSFSVGAGSWDKVTADGYISGPITDKLLGRLSASYSDHDGYYDTLPPRSGNIADEHHKSFRAMLRYLPTENLTIDLSVSYEEEEYHDISQVVDLDVFALISLFLPPEATTDEPFTSTQQEPFPHSEKESTMASLIANWDISDDLTLKSITAYVDHENPGINDADGYLGESLTIGAPGFPRFDKVDTFSQEFNLIGTSLDEKLDWTVGFFYFTENHKPLLTAFIPIFAVEFEQFYHSDADAMAAFVDLTYHVTDNFRINAGLRQSRDERDFQHIYTVDFRTNPFELCGPNSPLDDGKSSFDWDSTSPKLRFEWDASENHLLYVQWQEGFKTGGINIGECGDTYEPEEITAYEVGFKSILLDGAMTLNGSYFNYDYENHQAQLFPGGPTLARVVNLPGADIQGFDLELVWNATENLRIDGSVAYNDNEISESVLTTNPATGVVEDLKGNAVPHAPEWTAALGAILFFNTDAGNFTARAEVRYSDDVQHGLFDNPNELADEYTVGNIYLSYSSPSAAYEVRAFVRNVTDEEYLEDVGVSSLLGVRGTYARPRQYGVQLRYNF
ncbi:MAG: TonB-dependent receptor [Gammaproteobacteria bacterium]|nr:TonB-dependent receptor [Gammaproteobacteria bacterium]